jgi:hypothetical protein
MPSTCRPRPEICGATSVYVRYRNSAQVKIKGLLRLVRLVLEGLAMKDQPFRSEPNPVTDRVVVRASQCTARAGGVVGRQSHALTTLRWLAILKTKFPDER